MGQMGGLGRAAHLSGFVVGAELAGAGAGRTAAVASAAGTQTQAKHQGADEHQRAAFGGGNREASGSAARTMGRLGRV